MENGRFYVGEDLKFQITLVAEGFNQDSDRYDLEFHCGNYVHTYTQDDVVKGADGNHYLLIPTSTLAPGMMRMVITAYVPDADFQSGIRKEVEAVNLGPLKPVA